MQTVASTCVIFAVMSFASPAFAHAVLDSPNGGEVLGVGQTIDIRWHVTVAHNTTDWDLWYSTTGPNGPWIPIALDLPPGNISGGAMHSYSWVVPNTPSEDVWFRLLQDNTGTSYYDESDGALAIRDAVSVDTPTASISSGGSQTLTLSAGASHANEIFALLGSVTGPYPGTAYQGTVLPVSVDFYFLQTLNFPNTSPLSNSLGNVDANGQAVSVFTLPPGLPGALAGTTVWHCFAVVSATGLGFVSEAEPVTLTP